MSVKAKKLTHVLSTSEFSDAQISPNPDTAFTLQQKILHAELDSFDHSGMLYSAIDVVIPSA
jgi:hypothetical protein